MNSILLCSMELLLVIISVSCDGGNKYVSCSQINSFCMDEGQTDATIPSHTHYESYRTGKSGPKGEKGDSGPRGPPVNYDEIERRILGKVKEMIVNCRLVYNNSCFTLVGRLGNKYSKEDLQRKCERIGANLANIYNEEHRMKISRYIRSEVGVYAQVAMGITYNPQANTFRQTNGETTTRELSWHPGYPYKEQIHQNMFVSVQPAVASASQGAFNHKPHSDAFGLCEYPIEG